MLLALEGSADKLNRLFQLGNYDNTFSIKRVLADQDYKGRWWRYTTLHFPSAGSYSNY